MKLNKKFDLIIAAFRVLSHISEPEDQIRALNKVYDHLVPGGRFIFDLYVPNLKLLHEGFTENIDFDGEFEGKRLQRVTSMKADLINQISYVTMTFILYENGQKRIEKWEFPMRFYFRYEIEHLVKRSKLKLLKILGDFEGNDLCHDSKEFIVICSKQK
jgi:SAM-dependent methyltransferase